MNYSFCTAVGVVKSFDTEIRMDRRVLAAEVSIFSRESDTWDLSVCVAILEETDQKKAQSLVPGDVVFFTGRPTVMDGQSVILSNSFIILKKNKVGLPIELCKMSSLEYARLENVAAISGKVCASSGDFLNLMVKREGFYLRGQVSGNDYVKVKATNHQKVNAGDSVVCIGKISQDGVEGMVAVVNNEGEGR